MPAFGNCVILPGPFGALSAPNIRTEKTHLYLGRQYRLRVVKGSFPFVPRRMKFEGIGVLKTSARTGQALLT